MAPSFRSDRDNAREAPPMRLRLPVLPVLLTAVGYLTAVCDESTSPDLAGFRVPGLP